MKTIILNKHFRNEGLSAVRDHNSWYNFTKRDRYNVIDEDRISITAINDLGKKQSIAKVFVNPYQVILKNQKVYPIP